MGKYYYQAEIYPQWQIRLSWWLGLRCCGQVFFHSILVHISRKYPLGKYDGEKEAKRWKEIVKDKLNPRIRYWRLTKKKNK